MVDTIGAHILGVHQPHHAPSNFQPWKLCFISNTLNKNFLPILYNPHWGPEVNQQPPMHQLAILSTGWAVCCHSASDGVHTVHFFLLLTTVLFLFFGFLAVPLGPDLTHSYPTHLPTFISTASTLVPYLLSPTDITTLITSYPIFLPTILTTYPTNLATLHTQPPIDISTLQT